MTGAPSSAAATALGSAAVDQSSEREPLPAATWLLSFAIAAEIFSGNWGNFGVPAALDRVFLVLGLVALLLGGVRAVSDRTLRFRPLHVVLLVAAAFATASSIAAHTFDVSSARFALLDRFGLVPFLMFCLAPLVFGRERQRRFLLAVLIGVGLYLGIVNFFEGIGLKALEFPTYISNPNVGLHFGRARGPFVEAVADGLSVYMCAVAAAIGLSVWRQRWIRFVCGAVIVLAGLGILFTLTRAVWIGAVAGSLAALLTVPRMRRYILPAVIVGVIGVYAALALVPELSTKANDRIDAQSPVWDRYNTNAAALRMAEARPIFGFGWQTFQGTGPDYLRQADTYPQTGAGLEVHNVFLSHLAELGIVGTVLWSIALFGAVGGAIVRRGPPELYPWRVGLLAVFICFLIVANLGPLSYPFPNLLLWTWAGIAGAEFFLAPRRSARAGDGDDESTPGVPSNDDATSGRELPESTGDIRHPRERSTTEPIA
jgi:putative inorganic carbon (hco3(-)) transporter